MSLNVARRPARKRQPEERAGLDQSPVPDDTLGVVESRGIEPTEHDPGGWLAILLMVMAIASVSFITVLIWMAA